LLACQRTQRRAAAIEIDPHYVDTALARFQQRTGIAPIHESSGLTFEALITIGSSIMIRLPPRPSVLIEQGLVYLPRGAPWLESLRQEIRMFPRGSHDDQVDSISQFLAWVRTRIIYATFIPYRGWR
jgi:hypothetical protein